MNLLLKAVCDPDVLLVEDHQLLGHPVLGVLAVDVGLLLEEPVHCSEPGPEILLIGHQFLIKPSLCFYVMPQQILNSKKFGQVLHYLHSNCCDVILFMIVFKIHMIKARRGGRWVNWTPCPSPPYFSFIVKFYAIVANAQVFALD